MDRAQAIGVDPLALIETITSQLTERFDAQQRQVDARLESLHIDSQRNRREVLERIERLGQEFGGYQRRGFAAVERRLADVCDKGGAEHAAMRADIDAIKKRQAAEDARREGRGQVLAFVKQAGSWFNGDGWKLLIAASAMWGGLIEMPRVRAAAEARGAIVQQVEPRTAAFDPAPVTAQDWPLVLRD